MIASNQLFILSIGLCSLCLDLHCFLFLAESVGELSCVEERLG